MIPTQVPGRYSNSRTLALVHRGGFEPPRPTWGDRVTAGPFRPGSRTCAHLAEGRRIERPSLITMPRFSGPVAGHPAVPSTWRRVRESNPLASCESLGLLETPSRLAVLPSGPLPVYMRAVQRSAAAPSPIARAIRRSHWLTQIVKELW